MRTKELAISVVLLVSVVTAAAGARLAAQDSGDRVRITAPSRDLLRQDALLVSQGRDSLVVWLYESRERITLPYDLITGEEVYRGQRSDWLPVSVGLGLTGVVVGAVGGSCHSPNEWFCGGEVATLSAGFLGAIGFGLGALIGSAFHHDVWQSVQLPAATEHALHLGVSLARGGLAVTLRI